MSFDPSRLYTSLLNTRLQSKDNKLYQIIHDIIAGLVTVGDQTNTIISGGGSAGPKGDQGIQGPPGFMFDDDFNDCTKTNSNIQDLISNFTQGSVLFIGPSGFLAEDNSNFFWDNTNKRLGIGTNTPSVGTSINVIKNINLNPRVDISNSNAGTGAGIGFIARADVASALIDVYSSTNTNNFSALILAPNLVTLRAITTNAFLIRTSAAPIIFAPNETEFFRISTTGFISLGGQTSSFPAIKRSATAINFRLADDSNDAPITVANITSSGLITGVNLTLATSAAITFGVSGAINNTADGQFLFRNNANTSSLAMTPDHIYFSHPAGGNAIIANGAGVFLFSNEAQTIGFTLNGSAADILSLKNRANNALATFIASSIGIGQTPTAWLHIKAGMAAASSAPLKFTAGTLLTTPELGAMEFTDDGTTGHLYITLNQAGVLTRVAII